MLKLSSGQKKRVKMYRKPDVWWRAIVLSCANQRTSLDTCCLLTYKVIEWFLPHGYVVFHLVQILVSPLRSNFRFHAVNLS